jgi:hypothetical protein
MIAELQWWFWVFVFPELLFAAVGLIALFVAAISGGSRR